MIPQNSKQCPDVWVSAAAFQLSRVFQRTDKLCYCVNRRRSCQNSILRILLPFNPQKKRSTSHLRTDRSFRYRLKPLAIEPRQQTMMPRHMSDQRYTALQPRGLPLDSRSTALLKSQNDNYEAIWPPESRIRPSYCKL